MSKVRHPKEIGRVIRHFARTKRRSEMTRFRKIVSKLYRRTIYKKLKTRKEMSRLYGVDNGVSKSLANALNAVLETSISMEEKVWIDRIESLRDELNASSTEISILDYGEWSPELNLTAEEMYQGKVITKTIGEVCRIASVPHIWVFLLFKLVRKFKPSVCLELGTCLGISAAYQAAALELNHHGRIVTLEGAESLASLARENFERLGLKRVVVSVGRFQDTLGEVLREQAPVDFAFINGHHDEHVTLAYFKQIFPFLSESAVLVFDDINWSKGMERAWDVIVADKRIKVSVDLFRVGICIIARSPKEKQSFKIALD